MISHLCFYSNFLTGLPDSIVTSSIIHSTASRLRIYEHKTDPIMACIYRMKSKHFTLVYKALYDLFPIYLFHLFSSLVPQSPCSSLTGPLSVFLTNSVGFHIRNSAYRLPHAQDHIVSAVNAVGSFLTLKSQLICHLITGAFLDNPKCTSYPVNLSHSTSF